MVEVLKFYTSFCPPCHEVSRQLRGKEMKKINISKTQELATKYNVKSVPTLVFLKDDVEVYRHNGVITTQDYENIILDLKK
ncbi:MAG: thioredoxin family protein [Psychroflexus sp.]